MLIPTREQWQKWTLPSKWTVVGACASIVGIPLAIFLSCHQKTTDKNAVQVDIKGSSAVSVQAPLNSTDSISQNMTNSPGGTQIAVKGDLNTSIYYPISSELSTRVKQNLSKLAELRVKGFHVILRVESGNSQRDTVAKDFGSILSEAGIGRFPEGNTYIGHLPGHPITIRCGKNQRQEVNSFIEAVEPYIKGEVFVDDSQDESMPTIIMYLYGMPIFSPDGSVSFQ
jgi:hypothetical protein